MSVLVIEYFAIENAASFQTIFFYLSKTAGFLGLLKIFLIIVSDDCKNRTSTTDLSIVLLLLLYNLAELLFVCILQLFNAEKRKTFIFSDTSVMIVW